MVHRNPGQMLTLFAAHAQRFLRRLQLGGELIDGGDVVERGEVGVAGERVAFFAVHQNLHFQNAGRVGRDGVDQRGDREFLDQHAGAVSVGEGGVQVDDGDAGIDQVDAANVGAGPENVRRRLVEVERDAARAEVLRRAAGVRRAEESGRTRLAGCRRRRERRRG